MTRIPAGLVALACFAALLGACAPGAVPSGTKGVTRSHPSASPTPAPSPTRTPPPARAVLVDHGDRASAAVALTFDADMTPAMLSRMQAGTMRSPQVDERIVDLLVRTDTQATFFVTGLWARTYPDVVRRLVADARFEVENHSWDHRAWATPCYGLGAVKDAAGKRTEVVDTAAELTRLAGRRPHWFRFPGGCHADADLAVLAGEGHEAAGWDASGDAFVKDPSEVVRSVMATVQGGSIVVLHFNGAPNAPATYEALTEIIPRVRARGLRFVRLDDLPGVHG